MVKETMKWAGAYAKKNGPLFLEFDTYRYHGHSMSDPGITYRTKEEVMNMRQTRDPVEICKQMILEKGWATDKEMKATEKEIVCVCPHAVAVACVLIGLHFPFINQRRSYYDRNTIVL